MGLGAGLIAGHLRAETNQRDVKPFLGRAAESGSFLRQIAEPLPFDLSDESRYRACFAAMSPEPVAAIEYAESWLEEGGGFAATHCLALGAYHQGRMVVAASILHNLAQEMASVEPETAAQPKPSAVLRSLVLAQAGVLYDLGGDSPSAERELTRALQLNPNDPELLLDRAMIRGKQNEWQAVLKDLDQALKLMSGKNNPAIDEALVLRATALRHLSEFKPARESLDQVFDHAPRDPAGLIESGNLYLAVGNRKQARLAWMAVLKQNEQGVMADLARSLLERLDVSSTK